MVNSTPPPIIISDLQCISIGMLKRKGLLNREGTLEGEFNWVNSFTKNPAATIGFEILTQGANPYIKLNYTVDKQDIEFTAPLIKVLSNLGRGYLWFFHLENKKSSKLFMLDNHFETRQKVLDAGGIYTGQLISKGKRTIKMELDNVKRLFKITLQQTKPHFLTVYRGKITKRQKSVNRARAKLVSMGLGTSAAIQEYFGMG